MIVAIAMIFSAVFAGLFLLHILIQKNERRHRSCKRYEVAFKKEGRLAFTNTDGNDTLLTINIEIADDEEERTRGLMWRYSMPDSDGMLFIFEEERPLSFWMKNTYIPLDVIFVGKTGEIVAIQQNTIPLSETPIPSGKPARYVIEVNAWFCVDHSIKAGDKIIFDTLR
jgi:uncharacterized membrane protein (UPF0127 family)